MDGVEAKINDEDNVGAVHLGKYLQNTICSNHHLFKNMYCVTLIVGTMEIYNQNYYFDVDLVLGEEVQSVATLSNC